jgi:nucleoside-diphosphate-sugar epimerase
MTTKVLVTGASGFLGANFASTCSMLGFDVVRAARKAPPTTGWVEMPDLDGGRLETLPLEVDAVVHFAGIAHRYPPESPDAATYRRANGEAVGVLARACRGRAGAFVFVSSVAAAGTGRGAAITPATHPQPSSPYGEAKLLGERLATEALCGGTTAIRIVRLPSVFGRGAPGAVTQLGEWIRRGRPVPSACRHARRSVISVDDAVDAIRTTCLAASLNDRIVMPCAHETPNTLDLAQRIASAYGIRLRVVPCAKSALRATANCLRTLGLGSHILALGLERLLESCEIKDDTLQRLAGWKPPCGLDEGIRRAFSP